MLEEHRYLLPEFIAGLADAMDLVSPLVNGHHNRVACIAAALASELGLSDKDRSTLATAGLLHDSGALSLHDKLAAALVKAALQFETCKAGPGGS